ncbi:MAG: hypothetical protein ACXWTE_01290, partial [Methylobacter sp.]
RPVFAYWPVSARLQMATRIRELALFNLVIDSKLRGCDLVGILTVLRKGCQGKALPKSEFGSISSVHL